MGHPSQPGVRRLSLSRRPLLKAVGWAALVDMPPEEESLIRHCTLGRAEMDLIQAKRTPHNRLGLAIQLCFLSHLGRAIPLGYLLAMRQASNLAKAHSALPFVRPAPEALGRFVGTPFVL